MTFNRWMLWGASVLALGLLLVAAASLLPRPQPSVMCDDLALVESQLADVNGLATWAAGLLWATTLAGALLLIATFYCQLGFWMFNRWAPPIAFISVWVVTYVMAWLQVGRLQDWASAQTPSCLDEALRDGYVASHVAWSGVPARAFGLELDLHWATLLRADAFVYVAVSLMLGYAIYRGLRAAVRY